MKKIVTIILCAVMVLTMSLTAFAAGSWEKDVKGWKWNNGDGTYFVGGWRWCDGNNDGKSECYYFTDLGYALTDALTPDGYTVNADGAWVLDQIVQILATAAGPGATTAVSAPSDAETEKTFTQYVAGFAYDGVDGTEAATITFDGVNVHYDVISAKPSSELTPEKAKTMYSATSHSEFMQKSANDLMQKIGQSLNVIETVTTSDGVKVFEKTYYGSPI